MQFFLKYCTSLHVNSEGLRERDTAERMETAKNKVGAASELLSSPGETSVLLGFFQPWGQC